MSRPKGCKKEITMLLEYHDWIIKYDNPNYIIEKKSEKKYKTRFYCNSLENALFLLYKELIINNVNQKQNYIANLKALRDVILKTKKEFNDLLDMKSILKNEIKAVENETAECQ